MRLGSKKSEKKPGGSKKKKSVFLLCGLIILGAAGGGGAWFLAKSNAAGAAEAVAVANPAVTLDTGSLAVLHPSPVPISSEEPLTEGQYVNKISQIYMALQATSLAPSHVDPSDKVALLAAVQKSADKSATLYTEIKSLQAPAAFEEAQEKIKLGAEASLKILQINLDIVSVAAAQVPQEERADTSVEAEAQPKGDPSTGTAKAPPAPVMDPLAVQKIKDLKAEAVGLKFQAKDLTRGVFEVIGKANVKISAKNDLQAVNVPSP